MARRYTPSQIQSMIRQAQQKQQRAISDYNAAVRKRNQEVRRVVDNYNRAVRDHNTRVRANRQRLESELRKFSQQKLVASIRSTVLVTTTLRVTETHAQLERRAQLGLSPDYNQLLDLSEREAANSVAVANRLARDDVVDDEETGEPEDSELRDRLRQISPDLDDRWGGALFALNPCNPDAARHFCASAREIFSMILNMVAPGDVVAAEVIGLEVTDQGTPTRRSRLRYLLQRRGLGEPSLENFAEADIEDIVQLFRVFNDGTHGSAGTFSHSQLRAIRRRAEDGIVYLIEMAA